MLIGLIGHVARKEIKEVVRDRTAFLMGFFSPLLVIPIVMVLLPLGLAYLVDEEVTTVREVAVDAPSDILMELEPYFEEWALRLVPVSDVAGLVGERSFLAGVVRDEGGDWVVFAREAHMRSTTAATHAERALAAYQRDVAVARVAEAGLPASVVEPFRWDRSDPTPPSANAGRLLVFTVLFFLVAGAAGAGIPVTVDSTAGERERGTLEALLVAPVARSVLVLGKLGASVALGLLAAATTTAGIAFGAAGLGAVGTRMNAENPAASALFAWSLAPGTAALMFATTTLLIVLIGALGLAAATLAQSYKQAGYLTSGIVALLTITVGGLQFSEFFTVPHGLFAVPVLNLVLLLDMVVRTDATAPLVSVAWGSSVAWIAATVALATWALRRDGVALRPGA